MKNIITTFIKIILKKINIGIVKYSTLKRLIADSNELDRVSYAPVEIELIKNLNRNYSNEILNNWEKSRSQLRQDLFVLSTFLFKKKGYFVEFGATNGFDLSNTYLLEKDFSWTGILAEPARCWHKELYKNRNCNIEKKCVWNVSNTKITFLETFDKELSTIKNYAYSDLHGSKRDKNIKYDVDTISLFDMLEKHQSPKFIEYLSVDTEGSEYDILKEFPFNIYSFGVITIEHNFSLKRDLINKLLIKNGYKRVFENLSMFDDWYLNTEIK